MASFSAAPGAPRRAIPPQLADAMPRNFGLRDAPEHDRGARVRRHQRLGLCGMASTPVRRHTGEALAARRIARVRRARDQRLLLHADQAGDVPALVRGDSRRVSLRAQGTSLRLALQAAARLPRLDHPLARSGAAAAREARGRGLAAAQQLLVRPVAARRFPALARGVAQRASRARAAPPIVVHAGRRTRAERRRCRGVPLRRAGLSDVARGDDGPGLRASARAHAQVRLELQRAQPCGLGGRREAVARRGARRARVLRQRRGGACRAQCAAVPGARRWNTEAGAT